MPDAQATPERIAQYERGDFTRWECPDCGERQDILGTDALMVGCHKCKEERRVLVWMTRVQMDRVSAGREHESAHR